MRLDIRIVPICLVVALIAVSVFGVWPWTTLSLRTGKLALLELVLLVGAACLVKDKYARWFLVWTVIGVIMVYDWRSIVTCWRFILAFLFIQSIRERLNPLKIPQILSAWRWITVVHTSYMLLQATGIDPIFVDVVKDKISVTGFMDNSGISGAYTAMTLPLFFKGRWKFALIPSLIAIACTGSLGSFLLAIWMVCFGLYKQVYVWMKTVWEGKVFVNCLVVLIAFCFAVPGAIHVYGNTVKQRGGYVCRYRNKTNESTARCRMEKSDNYSYGDSYNNLFGSSRN